MNQPIKTIAIYPENYQFESDYLPLISFKTEKQRNDAENYIKMKVDIFFRKILKIDNIDVVKSQVPYSKIITPEDFKAKNISYFYDNIVCDLDETPRDSEGQLNFPAKWGITFDEKCTPISVSYLSSKYKKPYKSPPHFEPYTYTHQNRYEWNYKYGTIDINGQPIFYYIYFTLQEILDAIRNND